MKCDDLFAYTTTRLVVIRDRRLGLLRFALLFSCFVWVVVYQLYVKRGWADETPLSGGSLVLGINPTRNDKGEKHCHCYGGKESPLCGKEVVTTISQILQTYHIANFRRYHMRMTRKIAYGSTQTMLSQSMHQHCSWQLKLSINIRSSTLT